MEIIYIVVEGKTVSVGSFAGDSINIKYECGGGHQAAQLEQSPDYIYSASSQKNTWLLSIYIALCISKPLCRTSLINSPNALASTYYFILLASLRKLLMVVSTACGWVAFTKENFSKDSWPESRNNYHLKPPCFFPLSRGKKKKKRRLIINVSSGHSTPFLFKGKNVKIKESLGLY